MIILFVSRIGSVLLNMLTLYFLLNTLDESSFGLVSFVFGVALPLSGVARMGAHNLILKDVANQHLHKESGDISWAVNHYCLNSIFFLSLAFFSYFVFFYESVSSLEFVAICVGVLIKPSVFLEPLFVGAEKFYDLSLMMLMTAVSMCVSRVTILLLDPNFIFYALLLEALIFLFFCFVKWPNESIKIASQFYPKIHSQRYKDSFPYGVSSILLLFNTKIDQFIAVSFLSPDKFSIFMLFIKACEIFSVGIFTLTQYFSASIIADNKNSGRSIRTMFLFSAALSLLVSFTISYVPAWFVELVIPLQYQVILGFSIFFGFFIFLSCVGQLNGLLVVKLNKQASLGVRTGVAIFISTICGLILINLFGIYGAVMCTLLSLFVNGLLMYFIFPQLRVVPLKFIRSLYEN